MTIQTTVKEYGNGYNLLSLHIWSGVKKRILILSGNTCREYIWYAKSYKEQKVEENGDGLNLSTKNIMNKLFLK
jgi:hypothetical protein